MQLAWEGEALLVTGVPDGGHEQLRVLPEELLGVRDDALPVPPGAWRRNGDGGSVRFTPRFPFVPGRRYAVLVDGAVVGVLERPGPEGSSATRVEGVLPSGDVVPRNLLRLYVCFSARMSEGCAGGIHVAGLEHVFLPTAEELWDPARTRLTLFLDPARIKRGLVSHEALGYPLRTGDSVQLVVDGMRDAAGAAVERSVKEYAVGPDLRHRLDPAAWTVSSPAAGTREPLVVQFDRPLDRALLERTVHAPVPGTPTVGPAEQSWRFTPDEPWTPGPARLVLDALLEDVAGNSLQRAFDRDLADRRDDPTNASQVHLPFVVAPALL